MPRRDILENFVKTNEKVAGSTIIDLPANKTHLSAYIDELRTYHPADGQTVNVSMKLDSYDDYCYLSIELLDGKDSTRDLLDKLCFVPRSLDDPDTLVSKPVQNLSLVDTDWQLHMATIEKVDQTNQVTLYWTHSHPDFDELIVTAWRW